MNLEHLNHKIVNCRRCPRLVIWREQVARTKRRAYKDWDYWGRPVPGFGDPKGNLLVVGLAPGAHGSNRTGRMFTGDASGDFLYAALFRSGYANQPVAYHREDGLEIKDLYITAVCHCAPPNNKPLRQELLNCRSYLQCEVGIIQPKVVVALGRVAFENILQLYSLNGRNRKGHGNLNASWTEPHWSKPQFSHGAIHPLGPGLPWLVCSYHPSRQNTQTGRLTTVMFDQIWFLAKELLRQR